MYKRQSEDATPHKLQQARNRGSVARSPDLTGAVALLTGCLLYTSVTRKNASLADDDGGVTTYTLRPAAGGGEALKVEVPFATY